MFNIFKIFWSGITNYLISGLKDLKHDSKFIYIIFRPFKLHTKNLMLWIISTKITLIYPDLSLLGIIGGDLKRNLFI